jgi:hypothetical protein
MAFTAYLRAAKTCETSDAAANRCRSSARPSMTEQYATKSGMGDESSRLAKKT